MREKIKVLIAEDSPVVQLLLAHILGGDPEIQVIGTAADGQAAVDFVQKQRPDVILMDIHMPRMDGFEATRQIMEKQPLPIVICSATMKSAEVENTFRALEAGAVASVEKPVGLGGPNFDTMVNTVLRTIKDMAAVRLSRPRESTRQGLTASALRRPHAPVRIVAIGSSTGGPPALHELLGALPENFSAPVLIVQHIAAGFLDGMIGWLRKDSRLDIRIATQDEQLKPARVYVAPDNVHMGVAPGGRILLSQAPPENGLRPAVSFLFRSVTETYGASATGVLLSGMGRDGADELKAMKDLGAVTFAQDKESSVVHGMAGEAIRLDATTHVLPPDEIAAVLAAMMRRPPAAETKAGGNLCGPSGTSA